MGFMVLKRKNFLFLWNNIPEMKEGTVQESALVICLQGRCSFVVEGEYYELAKYGAIFLRKGQTVSSYSCSEDFSSACLDAPSQFVFSAEQSAGVKYQSRKSELFERFKNLLNIHYGREHDAFFYASQLRITQKYLSLVCKDVSGLSVKEWIDLRLLKDARFLLSHTNKTVSQISEILHFDSPELFGKFFKRMSSLSPRQFRTLCCQITK